MARLKYFLSIFIALILILIPTGIFVYAAFMKTEKLVIGDFEIKRITMYIIALALFVLFFILRKPLRSLRVNARRNVEYDEFGRSKSKGNYEHLSKAERNMIDLQKTADMERLLSTTEIKKITKQGSLNPQQDMDKLVGLIPVKNKMREMVARMEFDKSIKNKSIESSMSGRHMVFYGNVGTGKTTVARILTGFLYKYKYIQKNKCIEVDGNFFNAGESSALKTELLIKQAYGGVLFIDEAYSLMESTHGYEIIAAIIKQMEDNRDKFILILAGYTEEMKHLIDMNPGFASRIKEYLYFPDFTDDELEGIFEMMAKERNFSVDVGAYSRLRERIANEKRNGYFGNARTIRNILDDTIDKHSLNFYDGHIEKNNKFTIMDVDISIYPKT